MRRWRLARTLGISIALFAVVMSLGGCGAHLDSFNVVSSQGASIQNLFVIVLILSLFVFLLVSGVLIYVMVRYRARPGQGEPRQVTGNRRLEIIWTATPAAVLVVLFILSVRTMNHAFASQPDALSVTVIGHQWWWEYRYPGLGVVTANELHVPVGEPLSLSIESADVIHSFWVPKFGWKMDAIPTRTNHMEVKIDQPGTWQGTCTQYCGAEHAWMRIRIIAEPKAQFDAWVAQQKQPASTPTTAEAQRGEQVFMSNTCVNCHTIGGTQAHGTVGPDLTHLASRTTLGSGVVTNTPANLLDWISHVQSVKPAVLMPDFRLSNADLKSLVTYLEGLK